MARRALDAARRRIGGGDQHEGRGHEEEREVAQAGGRQPDLAGGGERLAVALADQHEAEEREHGIADLVGGLADARDQPGARGVAGETQRVDAEKEHEAQNEKAHDDRLRTGRRARRGKPRPVWGEAGSSCGRTATKH